MLLPELRLKSSLKTITKDDAISLKRCQCATEIGRDALKDNPFSAASTANANMVFTGASASGKPVIGGGSGGTEDSIVEGFTGYRVDPDNVDEVAASIVRVLKDEKLARTLGRNGREGVVKNFDWRDKTSPLEQVNMSIFKKVNTLGPSNP